MNKSMFDFAREQKITNSNRFSHISLCFRWCCVYVAGINCSVCNVHLDSSRIKVPEIFIWVPRWPDKNCVNVYERRWRQKNKIRDCRHRPLQSKRKREYEVNLECDISVWSISVEGRQQFFAMTFCTRHLFSTANAVPNQFDSALFIQIHKC